MTAEITFISAYQGVHNVNLDATVSRLNKAGVWDDLRTIIFSPLGMTMPVHTAISWTAMHTPPNAKFARLFSIGKEVGHAYSEFIELMLRHDEVSSWPFLLTMEHDNVVPPDGFIRLLARMQENPHLSAISGLYNVKGPDGYPLIFGKPGETHFRPQPPDRDGGLVECRGIGMGFSLFRMSMFKDDRLPRPLFKTKADATGTATHDLAFWAEASKLGYRCAVDCSVKVGHEDAENQTIW